MRNHNKYLLGIALLFAGSLPTSSQVSNDNEDEIYKIDTRWGKNDYVAGQVLVKFKDATRVQVNRSRGRFESTSVDDITSVLRKYGVDEMEQLLPREDSNRPLSRTRAYNGDVIEERDLSQLYCVKLSTLHQHETMQAVEELKALDEVEFAEPNYKVYTMAEETIASNYSGNPLAGNQWHLDGYGVKELWNKPIINKTRPIIAILDTGVDLTHPDLKDNLWTNTMEQYGQNGNDNDGNGFANDVHGWDFVNNTPNIRDNNMHGTHVAGIAAAANNGIGIVGANPQALIMPITVLQSDGAGDVATIIKGIDYAIANGATILNMSLGTYAYSQAFRQSLESAYNKAVLVAAAGNDGRCIYSSHWGDKHDDPEQKSMPMFPAAYSFVLGVQATDKTGLVTSYSNYDDDGNTYSCESTFFDPDGFNYELKVPGSKILSTIPGGNYKELNGTSMAAPLAAGAISVLMMVKQYDSQEILWGDLLHTRDPGDPIHTDNIAQAYNLTTRPAELDLIKIELRERKDLADLTEEDYSGDNQVDAGETVSIYPAIRTTFGAATNIKIKVEVDEFEDPEAVEIICGEVDFGFSLDAYGKSVSQNPLVIKVPNSIADARHIRLKLIVTCNEMGSPAKFPFTIVAHNMIKISGLINSDTKLTADHIYYVNGNLGVNKGATLTIEPGTRLEFATGVGLRAFGKLVAKGTPEKPIIFSGNYSSNILTHSPDGAHDHYGIYTNNDQTIYTLLPTEETYIRINSWNYRTVYYDENSTADPSKSFSLTDYLSLADMAWIKMGFLDYNSASEGWPGLKTGDPKLTDPHYLTPIVQKIFEDADKYCSQYSSVETDACKARSEISVNFLGWWNTYDNPIDTASYCQFNNCIIGNTFLKDCVLTGSTGVYGERNLIQEGETFSSFGMVHSNVVNNYKLDNIAGHTFSAVGNNNNFNNFMADYNGNTYRLSILANWPSIDYSQRPGYLGTIREDLIRPFIYELGNAPDTWGTIDLSNMQKEPFKEAHGIVWKVLVNGKDAQDEFEDMIPLGVGKHKFEVYFNRPMNKAVAPQISFGVRAPYTQQSVAEDGNWNADGTIYTAYKTITGKTMSDGLNRIYVQGAEDNEYFPCPYEQTRFNVIIQVAGSMATGFMADEGLGCVKLKWDKSSNVQEDALGYNVYRYHKVTVPAGWRDDGWHNEELVNDTIQLNQGILDLETTGLTDYDVTPEETYYYFYKLLGTDLQEADMSNTVAATPRTSTRGDANGSGSVDVADVITTANYITKQNPQPFIFEAADMNDDKTIDILDVMSIVRGILNPSLLASALTESSAVYTVEDGMLYVESPVALGGVQVQLALNEASSMKSEDFSTTQDLEGFETASTWLSDNDYLFLAYSMNGKTLSPGKHALLYIGDSGITSIRLSDATGRNVEAIGNEVTTVSRMGSNVMKTKGVYDLFGRKIDNGKSANQKLPHGVYVINGKKVVK